MVATGSGRGPRERVLHLASSSKRVFEEGRKSLKQSTIFLLNLQKTQKSGQEGEASEDGKGVEEGKGSD